MAVPKRLRKIAKGYRSVAILLLNTIVVFILANVLIGVAFWIRDWRAKPGEFSDGHYFELNGAPRDNGKRTGSMLQYFDYRAYEKTTDEKVVSNMLDDFFDYYSSQTNYIYQPWVVRGPNVFKSKHLNVKRDHFGIPFRNTIHPPSEQSLPMVRIALFGGSTTFGEKVSDEHTWPSALASILNDQAQGFRVEVFNYGRVAYFPSEETALFADVLKSGFRPHLAIFLDGLNVGPPRDVATFDHVIEEGFEELQRPALLGSGARKLPMIRLARGWAKRKSSGTGVVNPNLDRNTDHIANRFRAHRDISEKIGELFGVDTLFILQPNGLLSLPLDHFRSGSMELRQSARKKNEEIYAKLSKESGWLDLTHLLEDYGFDRMPTVDGGHYGPGFARFLAETVAAEIDLEGYEPTVSGVEPAAATGLPRNGKLVPLKLNP